MQAQSTSHANSIRFDTDSAPMGIDNRCSGCISHVAEDFIGGLNDSNKTIKGFWGTRTSNIKIGTLRWIWLDEMGQRHKFLIPNSYYVPSVGVRLLSPQYWDKSQKKSKIGKLTMSQTTSK